MKLRGEIYLINDKIFKRESTKLHSPCIECDLKNICSPHGVINPNSCPYLLNW
jgi:hypothetical protein